MKEILRMGGQMVNPVSNSSKRIKSIVIMMGTFWMVKQKDKEVMII